MPYVAFSAGGIASMDYFSKFLRANQPSPKVPTDHAQEFHRSWDIVKNTLLHPDERQLSKGIKSTNVPTLLQSMVDSLVWESTRTEEGGTGACLEYLLKNDVLGTLVRLSEPDRPFGIQAEVLRTVQNMVVLLDEQFLVHSGVHKSVLRLLRNCAGDDLQEQLDGRKVMGAAWSAVRGQPSEYEEDLVNLLCILCSRIRTYRELLMIFFHDKHWYHAEPLFSVTEEDEEELEDDDEEITSTAPDFEASNQADSLPLAHSASLSSEKKPEYEFLLFNYLLRFVHREGHIGDFARAGLLFLMDVAMSPGKLPHSSAPEQTFEHSASDPIDDAALALAEYILDGDFSEVLGAGLGAVYSLLPSKLVFYANISLETSSGNGMALGSRGPGSEHKEKEDLAKETSRAMGVEDASNPEFKSRLDHFLKLLEFLQDVLRKNNNHDSIDAPALVGTAIGHSILDAVRRIFLENVLYPSILECSDADGSAVAVMSYIEIMVRTLQNGPLADLLVNFLVTEDNDEVRLRQRPFSMLTLGTRSTSQIGSEPGVARGNKLRRRKSSAMVLLEMEAPESRKKSEYFTSMGRFTLRDLLLSNLRSNSQSTATSALQLLQSMLLYHPQLTADRILLAIADPTATSFPHPAIVFAASADVTSSTSAEVDDDTFVYPESNEVVLTDPILNNNSHQFVQPETTYSTHEREMGLYLTLVSRVDPSYNGDPFSTGYDHYLRDALASIQSQSAYQLTDGDIDDLESRRRLKHKLNVNDSTLSLILDTLRRFFANTPEFNIALTGVLATLAIHPDRSLAGWLTFVSNDSPKSNEQESKGDPTYGGDDGDDRSIDFGIETRLATDMNFLPASSMDENARPVVHAIFHGLVTQLERYRLAINHFDKFLLERRQGLLFSENLTDALTIALDLTEEPNTAGAFTFDHPKPPNSKPKASASSFVSFLTPKKNKNAKVSTSSEPSTPSKGTKNPDIVASPFGKHYQDTSSIVVEPFVAPVPAATSWTPVKREKWTADEDDVFTSSGWSENPQREFGYDEEEKTDPGKPTHVTLSQLLDNVVILEESIKELVAIIHARRSLGIDSIRYL